MALYSKLQKLLQEAGLSETEIYVYLELLRNPAQTKWELVTRTGLNRNSVYRAFQRLQDLKMVMVTKNGIKAQSLKALVAELNSSIRNQKKLANKIKNIAPFLRVPQESIQEFETFYTRDQIRQAYLFMSEQDYDVNLDFGDFENFVSVIGSMEPSVKFRNNRVKHATSRAICTTFGPRSAFFSTPEAKEKFKVYVDHLNIDFKGNFIIFSDNNDFVLFNHFSDPDNQYSALVKSKAVADIQRMQFDCFSQLIEK